jgi:hypothetical protein
MKKWQLSRRTLLRGTGAALALPFLEQMWPSAADAQAAPPPRRFLGWYVPCGMYMQKFTPPDVGTGYTFTPILQPLAAQRNDFLVLSGVANRPGEPDGPGDHASGTGAFLTATHPFKTEGADIRNGISIDQVIANQIGQYTRFPSLQLGVYAGASVGGCDSGYSCAYENNVSWAGPATPLPKEIEPQSLFDRLTGDLPLSDAEARKRRHYQQSVLDVVREDSNRLQSKLGRTDNRKLDEYLTSVREIERRIQIQAPLCAVGTRPNPPVDIRDRTRLILDLIVVAFQCDLTRVVTFMLENGGSNYAFDFLGFSGGHHGYSHHGTSQANYDALQAIDTWEMQQFAYFLTKMKSVQEPGGTLLDNSVVFMSSEISDGDAHNHNNMPVIVAGRGRGAISPGRHVRFASEVPVANLFISLAAACGVNLTTFGDNGTGPCPGLI